MNSMVDSLRAEMKQALKERDMTKVSVIRFLLSDVTNATIDQGELSDEQVTAIIKKQVKQVQEAITEFEKAGRTELVELEHKKKEILEAYLPEQLSEIEVRQIISQVKEETQETHAGKLTGLVMKRVAGKADGGTVARLVQEAT